MRLLKVQWMLGQLSIAGENPFISQGLRLWICHFATSQSHFLLRKEFTRFCVHIYANLMRDHALIPSSTHLLESNTGRSVLSTMEPECHRLARQRIKKL